MALQDYLSYSRIPVAALRASDYAKKAWDYARDTAASRWSALRGPQPSMAGTAFEGVMEAEQAANAARGVAPGRALVPYNPVQAQAPGVARTPGLASRAMSALRAPVSQLPGMLPGAGTLSTIARSGNIPSAAVGATDALLRNYAGGGLGSRLQRLFIPAAEKELNADPTLSKGLDLGRIASVIRSPDNPEGDAQVAAMLAGTPIDTPGAAPASAPNTADSPLRQPAPGTAGATPARRPSYVAAETPVINNPTPEQGRNVLRNMGPGATVGLQYGADPRSDVIYATADETGRAREFSGVGSGYVNPLDQQRFEEGTARAMKDRTDLAKAIQDAAASGDRDRAYTLAAGIPGMTQLADQAFADTEKRSALRELRQTNPEAAARIDALNERTDIERQKAAVTAAGSQFDRQMKIAEYQRGLANDARSQANTDRTFQQEQANKRVSEFDDLLKRSFGRQDPKTGKYDETAMNAAVQDMNTALVGMRQQAQPGTPAHRMLHDAAGNPLPLQQLPADVRDMLMLAHEAGGRAESARGGWLDHPLLAGAGAAGVAGVKAAPGVWKIPFALLAGVGIGANALEALRGTKGPKGTAADYATLKQDPNDPDYLVSANNPDIRIPKRAFSNEKVHSALREYFNWFLSPETTRYNALRR